VGDSSTSVPPALRGRGHRSAMVPTQGRRKPNRCSTWRGDLRFNFGAIMHTEFQTTTLRRLARSVASLPIFGALLALALGTVAAGAAGDATVPAQVTFTEHVAPILFEHCARCHRPGEAAPFSLLTFEDAKKRARLIADVTESRFMPPWHAGHGYVEFSNARRLTDAQIAVVGAWVKQGAREGEASKLPATPKFTEGWQLGKPDLIVKMPEPFEVSAEGKDIYWNFVLPLNLPEDKWVRAIEFRPQARSVVHHSLFYLDTTGDGRKFDERDPKPGYNGMNRSNRQFESLGGWAVGSEPVPLPGELAWRFPTNSDLVLQTHFHPNGKMEHETSSVGIYFAGKPPTRQFTTLQLPPLFGRLSGMDIPAGATNYAVRDSFTTPIDLEAISVSPHAHYLGKTFLLTATLPDGKQQTLLKIDEWDFKWQEDCAYKNRIRLPKGTRLDAVITYDNSEGNRSNPANPPKRVKWGPMTTDEMAAMTLTVIPARDEELVELKKAKREHAIDLFIDRAQEDKRASARERVQLMLTMFDKNTNGKLDREERPPLRAYLESSGAVKGITDGF
jgi:mono/diheme cytochrome c family protein